MLTYSFVFYDLIRVNFGLLTIFAWPESFSFVSSISSLYWTYFKLCHLLKSRKNSTTEMLKNCQPYWKKWDYLFFKYFELSYLCYHQFYTLHTLIHTLDFSLSLLYCCHGSCTGRLWNFILYLTTYVRSQRQGFSRCEKLKPNLF